MTKEALADDLVERLLDHANARLAGDIPAGPVQTVKRALLREAADRISSLTREREEAREALRWRPIDTLGFGVEDQIILATDAGFAWVEECDKDANGDWFKRAHAYHAENMGEVTHWRLLGPLPVPASPCPLEEHLGSVEPGPLASGKALPRRFKRLKERTAQSNGLSRASGSEAGNDRDQEAHGQSPAHGAPDASE